jgi:DNA-binding SARP family transcriptional activator
MLEFRILGPLEVAGDRGVISIGAQKQRALLAVLLVHANEVVSVDRLVDSLWGADPPRTATTSLQNFVAQLRKLLGPDVLVTRPPGYALRVGPEQLDLTRFEAFLDGARGAPAEDRAASLREALALWRGSPLADFTFEPFAEAEVRRLEELRLVALEERIEADLELGRHAELVAELEALVDRQPLRERLRAQLMLALYRSGRQAQALQAYQEARRTLIEELGIDPSPQLQQLHASILRQETALHPSAGAGAEDDHLDDLLDVLLSGRLVPVLGGGVNAGNGGVPGAEQIAARLASSFRYPATEVVELPRVSQYAATLAGAGPLYDELHDLFAAEFEPGPVHRFLAALPPLLRERGLPHQLVVTTGYDLSLEQALLEAGEEFDVVSYLAAGPHRGKFCHVAPDGCAAVIDVPNTYATELSLDRRTVILKLHGQVDRGAGREWESFLVTEDDYISYLAGSDIASVVPVALVAKLRRSHFLFFAYAMRDWNLRVILNRLWGDEKLGYRSWAVQADASAVERAFWRRRDCEIVTTPLDAYVDALARRLEALRPAEVPA